MKTVAKIIVAFGGLERLRQHDNYIRLENPPYMRLVVEYIGQGPRGLPAIAVAHYFEQNGDAMRDPEMVFEVNPDEDSPSAATCLTEFSCSRFVAEPIVNDGKKRHRWLQWNCENCERPRISEEIHYDPSGFGTKRS